MRRALHRIESIHVNNWFKSVEIRKNKENISVSNFSRSYNFEKIIPMCRLLTLTYSEKKEWKDIKY